MQAPRCRPRGWPKRCLIPMVRSGARLALKEARKGRTHAVAARLHSIAWTPSLLPGCQRTSIGRGRPAMTPRLRPFRSPPDLETGARARFPLVEALRVSGATIAIRLSRAAANDQCDLSDRRTRGNTPVRVRWRLTLGNNKNRGSSPVSVPSHVQAPVVAHVSSVACELGIDAFSRSDEARSCDRRDCRLTPSVP
jgi:hypothetical protein